MKKIISVMVAIALVISCFSIAVTAHGDKETKVSFTATSNDTAFLIGEVFSDYSAKITAPKGSVINAGEVTGSLTMTDIASLGIEGTRTYEKSITTGVDNEVNFDKYIPAFSDATVSGTIDGMPYAYDVFATDSDKEYVIEAIPENEEDVRKAYQAAVSHVTSSTKAEDDSYAEIPGTAYIQIGTEKLSLENTDETLKLDNIVQGTGLKAELRSAVKLEEVDELEDAQVEVFLPAGTILAMGQSVVTLDDDATIKMYGYEDNDDVNTILSKFRDCETNEEIILTAVLFVTDFAMAIDGKDLVVNVEFAESGVDVTGTVESFKFDDETTVELVLDGEIVQTAAVSGYGVKDYAFEGIFDGTYTLRVSKDNHVTREYEITVAGEAVTAELKIHLIGDVNGDGAVNTIDVARVNSHARSVNALDGYSFDCGDVNADGNINTIDVARINSHARSVNTLW
ncbi:MAG: hypothetical protein E7555_07845 [Ruminococcaceae bacterium]|nr:hypothetical protein [Oscillospiraceae bacterium]